MCVLARPTPAGRFETVPYTGYGAPSRASPTAKYGDTMGKTVPNMARLNWSALVEQNHVQMVSPYFSQPLLTGGQPRTQNPERVTQNPAALRRRTRNPGL